MIRISTDEDVHEYDLDLIRDYATALFDKDQYLMSEVLYLTEQRMERDCQCFAVHCVCGLV